VGEGNFLIYMEFMNLWAFI